MNDFNPSQYICGHCGGAILIETQIAIENDLRRTLISEMSADIRRGEELLGDAMANPVESTSDCWEVFLWRSLIRERQYRVNDLNRQIARTEGAWPR